MFKEFKEFAFKGNVIDLAVGVVIGGAFGTIVSSLVSDIILPVIGVLLGGIDFSYLTIVLVEGSTPETTVSLNYGNFLNAVVNFLIISFSVFIFVKHFSLLLKQEEKTAAPIMSKEAALLTEIRDLLSKKR
jgi:large conductance mechanosensitive channel